jgi:hypothetical protein
VDADSRTAAVVTRNGDVDETPLGKELPKRGGAGVAEHGVGPAGEHRRHPPALLAEPAVSDGVNTAMKAMQLLCLHAPGQALAVNAKTLKLRYRHDAMLIRRKPSDLGGVGEFLTHVRE